jgi:hypothetical protein
MMALNVAEPYTQPLILPAIYVVLTNYLVSFDCYHNEDELTALR